MNYITFLITFSKVESFSISQGWGGGPSYQLFVFNPTMLGAKKRNFYISEIKGTFENKGSLSYDKMLSLS